MPLQANLFDTLAWNVPLCVSSHTFFSPSFRRRLHPSLLRGHPVPEQRWQRHRQRSHQHKSIQRFVVVGKLVGSYGLKPPILCLHFCRDYRWVSQTMISGEKFEIFFKKKLLFQRNTVATCDREILARDFSTFLLVFFPPQAFAWSTGKCPAKRLGTKRSSILPIFSP